MTDTRPAHEFVHFAFRAEVPLAEQRALMASVLPFVRAQPGFVARSTYFSAEASVWIDHVVWQDLALAKAAGERAMQDPQMAPLMAKIEQSSMSYSHYTEE